MTRYDELLEAIGRDNETKAGRLIEEVVFLEEQMTALKKLPFVRVNPKDTSLQKQTPAARVYREMLSQYNNALRLLLRVSGDLGDEKEESPLRKWMRDRVE